MQSISIFVVFSIILVQFLFGEALPQSQGLAQQLSVGQTAPGQPTVGQTLTGQSSPMTTQSVNNGINLTQQFIQLMGMLFNNFNTFIPRFVNLFTGQNPIATDTASVLPLPDVSSLQSIQSGLNNDLRPEKFNKAPITPKHTELFDNDVINDTVDILSV